MTGHLSHSDVPDLVLAAVHTLFAADVMSHSGQGNLNACLGEDRFLLTTTGVVRDLRPEQLATVTLAGDVEDGELASDNSEIVAMHSVNYQERPDVGSVIHPLAGCDRRRPRAPALAVPG